MCVIGNTRGLTVFVLQEVETSPSSARHSGLAASSRHSLSSTERSSLSRASTENYQQPPQIEAQPDRPTADKGYQTAPLEEVMARASEFTPGVLDRLKQRTNDVFYSQREDDSTDSYQQMNYTPDSLSTGKKLCIGKKLLSSIFTQFYVLKTKHKPNYMVTSCFFTLNVRLYQVYFIDFLF